MPMIEVSEIRRRLRQAIEQVRRTAVERRARAEAAARAYEEFLSQVATPVFRMFASALNAEGYRFAVFTPVGGLRLMSERSPEDFIELFLDAESDPPAVAGRTNRGRGRRVVTAERPVREDTAVEQLTDEDLVEFLLAEIAAFIER